MPRFVPSDFSLDFQRLMQGSNRNLNLRRDFASGLSNAPLAVTLVLYGAFVELLTGPAPLMSPRLGRVLYWGDPNVAMDFTAMDDVAAFAAAAPLDTQAPRTAWSKPFEVTRAGSLKALERLIAVLRFVAPQSEALYPPWQAMQYLHNMFAGAARLTPLDNRRYPEVVPTPVPATLAAYAAARVAKNT